MNWIYPWIGLAVLVGLTLGAGISDDTTKRSGLPVGMIASFAGSADVIPREDGWLLCDGTVVSSSEYPDLFQTIGYAWGKGRGVGDFRLPDLRGRFLRGVDSEAESVPRDPGRDIREAAYPGGNSGNDVGSVQEDSFKQHSHGLWGSPWAIGNGVDGTPQLIKFHAAKSPDDSAPEGVNPNAILSEGGLETRPKNCYVNWMIKARPD